MPATWGFGNTGSEPITMAGWGYLTDLAGVEPAVAPFTISFNVKRPGINFTAKRPAKAFTVQKPEIKVTVR